VKEPGGEATRVEAWGNMPQTDGGETMSDEDFKEQEEAFWDDVKRNQSMWLVKAIITRNPSKSLLPTDDVERYCMLVVVAERKLEIAEKILANVAEPDSRRYHAEINVRAKEGHLLEMQTCLFRAEVQKKLLPKIETWSTHDLEARIGDKRPLKPEFDLVHADEDFVRSTLESVLKEQRAGKALDIATAAKDLANRANALAKKANENSDMANVHMIKTNKIAEGADRKSTRSNWIAVVSALAAVAAAAAAFTR
jgi:hypothetical protein